MRKDGQIAITYRTGETTIEKLLHRLRQAGVGIGDLATEEPDLEDVFVALTSGLIKEGTWQLASRPGEYRPLHQAGRGPRQRRLLNALDHVNALADASPGFVWRLKGEGNNATDIRPFRRSPMAINMSVWESVEALAAFAYRNMDHRGVMRRRREWFEEMKVYMALWWIPAGTLPTLEDAKAKLELLERLGPTPDAFTFKQPFPPPSGVAVKPVLDECA